MTKRFAVSRMGVNCLLVSALAFAASACLFFFLYSDVTTWALDLTSDSPYWEKHVQRLSDSFQEYVTENGLSKEEAAEDTTWKSDHRSVHFYLTRSSHKTDTSDYFESEIRCSDGVMYTYITPRTSHFDSLGMVVSLVVAALLFFLILIPFVVHMIRRVTHLSREMDILSGGQMDHSIDSPGEDELALLGQSIEGMRLSVLEQMKREDEAIAANGQLVTSLSHDLRTPLTKLTGYLEILRYKRYSDPAEEEKYLDRALDNARQLKNLSDKLFESFLVKTDRGEPEKTALAAGSSVLTQMFKEFDFDLKSAGFLTDFSAIEGSCDVLMSEVDLRRIFDNLFSNIKKYAEPSKEVSAYYKRHEKTISVGIGNDKKPDVKVDGSGIGLQTVRQLMEANGGGFDVLEGTRRFVALLRFPIQ